MNVDPDGAGAEMAQEVDEPGVARAAGARSLHAARSRAEERVQRFLDAAFELIDEKGTTEFTIQEVIDRSKQSLRGFYQYFDGKDELVLALFEETVREAATTSRRGRRPRPIRSPVSARSRSGCTSGAIPTTTPRSAARTTAGRSRSSRCSSGQPSRPRARRRCRRSRTCCVELLDDGDRRGRHPCADLRRAAALMQQTVMYSWFGNRLVQSPRQRITAEETWEFCLHGLK